MQERRFYKSEIRAGEGYSGPTIEGYAARFGVLSHDLSGFRERISPGAFSRSIREGHDVKCLVNHDSSRLLGRVKNGTLRLLEDGLGLQFNCLLPDTQEGRDVYTLVKRGDLGDCSFAFDCDEQQWSEEDDPETGERIAVRTLISVRTYDVSVVCQPAYPETSVEVSGMSVGSPSFNSLFPDGVPSEVRSRIDAAVLKRSAPARAIDKERRRRELMNKILSY
jgi:uncharacterized protein